MSKTMQVSNRNERSVSDNGRWIWRSIQAVFWLIGLGIFLLLVFFPKIGIHAFWDVLIPVAPALFVLGTGFWRNVCPLGTVSLFPRHFGFSKRIRLKLEWQGIFHLIGVCLLFLIVPLRHLVFDTDGRATAVLLALTSVAAFAAGYFFEWKSGWCSGLCPVHPVERLYGQKVLFSLPNAHCEQCHNCVIPCPDSTPGMNPSKAKMRWSQRFSSDLLTGGLPGFIWAWFHVPDFAGAAGWKEVLTAYGLPWMGLLASYGIFRVLRHWFGENHKPILISSFAAAALISYYWYRIPALVGYGLFPGNGMLVNLRGIVPAWSLLPVQIGVLMFFTWWLVFRKTVAQEWVTRPPFARMVKQIVGEDANNGEKP